VWALSLALSCAPATRDAGGIGPLSGAGAASAPDADDGTDTGTNDVTDLGTDTHSDTGAATDSDTAAEPAGPFGDASALLHPEFGALFTASWTQTEATDTAWVEVSVDADVWLPSPARAGTIGTHSQLVIGAPYGAEVRWRVAGTRAKTQLQGETQTLTTGPLPDGVPETTCDGGDPARWDAAGEYLLTSVSDSNPRGGDATFWIAILDRQGRYVWLHQAPAGVWTLFPKPSRDGTAILWDEPYYWTWDNNEDSQVHRMRLDGTVERSWSTPWLHHSFDELATDTIVWNGLSGTDDVVRVSVGAEPAVDLWHCMRWLVEENARTREPGESCGANGLNWYEPTDTLVVSLFSHELVVGLDRATGDSLWFAEPERGLGMATDTPWAWQHDARLIADDRLLLLSAVTSGTGIFETIEATALYEYQVDTTAAELNLEWQAQSDDWVSAYKGGGARLPSGNSLMNFGDLGGIRELTDNGETVWELSFVADPTNSDRDHWVGRATWMGDLYAMVE
jgi:Arylsulfotransferase (ASST)